MARYTLAYVRGQAAARLAMPAGAPVVVLAGVTNHCNLRCDSCFHADNDIGLGQRRPKGHMPFERFERLVAEARHLTTYLELGLFGEPLLHPHCIDMVRHATTAGLTVGIVTNGTRLDGTKARALVEAQPSAVSFSVDGTDPAEFERLRVGARWDRVARAIEDVARARDRLGVRKPLLVARGLAVAPGHEDAARAHTRRLRALGVDRVLWTTPHNWSGSLQPPQGSVQTPDVPERTALCPYPWLMLTVDWDGTVGPCCADFHAKNRLGSLDEDSLAELWGGGDLRALRAAHRTRDRARIERETGCAGCSVLSQPTLSTASSAQLAGQALGELGHRLADARWP